MEQILVKPGKIYLPNGLFLIVPSVSGEELLDLCAHEPGDGPSTSCSDDEDILVSGAEAKEGTGQNPKADDEHIAAAPYPSNKATNDQPQYSSNGHQQ